jgi:nucleotide-binding universal stress UspA family protein
MNRILVPSDGDDHLSLHAAYFAFELAKRTGASVSVLTVAPAPADGERGSGEQNMSNGLAHAVSAARLGGVEVASHFTSGDYVERVVAFARDHHVSRIVVALPEAGSGAVDRVEERVRALRGQLNCILVTVRPRRRGAGVAAAPTRDRGTVEPPDREG